MNFVLDIKEKEVGAVKAPSFPQPKTGTSGQPEHRKRTRVSAFKQQRRDGSNASTTPAPKPAPVAASQPICNTSTMNEQERIDKENRNVLASMSAEEIAQERQELLDRLDPSIVEMLLKRANIDDHNNNHSVFGEPLQEKSPNQKPDTSRVEDEAPSNPPLSEERKNSSTTKDKPRKSVRFDEETLPCDEKSHTDEHPQAPQTTTSTTTTNPDALAPNVTHFPHPASLPDLDPDDPDFLETLHKKYFPSLPADPSKLAWMAPLPTPNSLADRESPYYPGQSSLSISSLRFDFKGRLLAPSRSRQIPVTKGLHHHGEAPEAAGYTIAELGRYARSAVPAQRCVAFQTLGRLLYRLGKGEFGTGTGDVEDGDMARGIWRTAQENRILDTLVEAADVPEGHGHRGSRAYAMEAVWLFEKGGWREKFQGR